jgi:phosphoribosyl 1,2-cyclic phosphodiesterase
VDPRKIDAIFLSHEHGDHARGAARFARKHGTLVAGTRATLRAAGLDRLGSPLLAFAAGETVKTGSLKVSTAPISHDAADPVGFRIEAGERRVGFALDLGQATNAVQELLAGCHAMVLESNHDLEMLERGPYPRELKERLRGPLGHLSNGQAGALFSEVSGGSTRTLVLAHLSRTNNRPELAAAAARSALRGRASGVRVTVAEQGPSGGWIDA